METGIVQLVLWLVAVVLVIVFVLREVLPLLKDVVRNEQEYRMKELEYDNDPNNSSNFEELILDRQAKLSQENKELKNRIFSWENSFRDESEKLLDTGISVNNLSEKVEDLETSINSTDLSLTELYNGFNDKINKERYFINDRIEKLELNVLNGIKNPKMDIEREELPEEDILLDRGKNVLNEYGNAYDSPLDDFTLDGKEHDNEDF